MDRDNWLIRNLNLVLVGMVVVAVACVAGAFGYYWRQFGALGLSDSQATWGQFGDYFGGVLNALLSFLALVALAMTLRVQSAELAMSTKELRNSADALKKQNASLEQQNFENTFFELIRLHNDIVRGIDLRDPSTGNVKNAGRDCFKSFYKILKNKMHPALRGDHLSYEDALSPVYEEFFNEHESDLGHYFRHLYRVFKFLDSVDAIENKRSYAGIVRAQLSSYELTLLFYNGVSRHGAKFKEYLERYELFENMRVELLLNWDAEKSFYARRAFGDQAKDLFSVVHS